MKRQLGLRIEQCSIGQIVRLPNDSKPLMVVDLLPESGLITIAFRKLNGKVDEYDLPAGCFIPYDYDYEHGHVKDA